jgi:transcriptional regulator with XRE-family HTH domain
LLATGRRHTPGLRREEVAVLAGVSASWYTWLEQGRDIKVSDGVLDAVCNALRLDDTERAHLYRLAGANPPQSETDAADQAEVSRLRLIVNGWLPAPAFIVDRYWNVLAVNESAQSMLGLESGGQNYLAAFFADPAARLRYPDWEQMAARLVGQFRVQAARFPQDSRFDRMARRLCASDQAFAALWARHETCDTAMTSVRIRLPGQDSVHYEHLILALLESSDLRLMLYVPQGTQSGETGLQLMAS